MDQQEVHILHEFASDFYGLEIRVVVLGYVRPEYNYDSMGEYGAHRDGLGSAITDFPISSSVSSFCLLHSVPLLTLVVDHAALISPLASYTLLRRRPSSHSVIITLARHER